jgi:flagella basal body P-ring formation protein FlgA
MDVSISAGGEKLLALGVDLDVKQVVRTSEQITQTQAQFPQPIIPSTSNASSTINPVAAKTQSNPTQVVVHLRQRVMMVVRMGGLSVTATGEAQQEGRMGQMIMVQNVESKKTVNARVTGPGTVEVEVETKQQ